MKERTKTSIKASLNPDFADKEESNIVDNALSYILSKWVNAEAMFNIGLLTRHYITILVAY